jgi:hypothetical protein
MVFSLFLSQHRSWSEAMPYDYKFSEQYRMQGCLCTLSTWYFKPRDWQILQPKVRLMTNSSDSAELSPNKGWKEILRRPMLRARAG